MLPFQIERTDYVDRPVTHTEHEVVLTETEARSAVPTGRVRYILAISLSASIVALAAVYFLLY